MWLQHTVSFVDGKGKWRRWLKTAWIMEQQLRKWKKLRIEICCYKEKLFLKSSKSSFDLKKFWIKMNNLVWSQQKIKRLEWGCCSQKTPCKKKQFFYPLIPHPPPPHAMLLTYNACMPHASCQLYPLPSSLPPRSMTSLVNSPVAKSQPLKTFISIYVSKPQTFKTLKTTNKVFNDQTQT